MLKRKHVRKERQRKKKKCLAEERKKMKMTFSRKKYMEQNNLSNYNYLSFSQSKTDTASQVLLLGFMTKKCTHRCMINSITTCPKSISNKYETFDNNLFKLLKVPFKICHSPIILQVCTKL